MEQNDTPRPALPDFAPVPRKRKRHGGWTPERQRAFVEALADSGSVSHAARCVGMASEGAYQLRRQPGAEEFAAAWEAALAHGVRRLEDIAMERALNGVEAPVYSYGKLIGTRTVYNDRLLMFILRNRAPHRFDIANAARGEPTPEQIEKLHKQWQVEANEKASSPEMVARIREELAKVRSRLAAGDRARAAAQEEERNRAIVLPRGEGCGVSPDML